MILRLILVLAALVAVFVVVVSLRPNHFRVARSVTIHGPASLAFSYVNTSRGWEAWSPWTKLDPQMRVSYEGPPAGVGAITAFEGRKCGTGRSTVVESREGELIRFRLDMTKPMNSTSDAEFTFKPTAGGTVVTWSLSGENAFMAKAVGLFINCDKMIGDSFELGLNQLKAAVEKPKAVAAQ